MCHPSHIGGPKYGLQTDSEETCISWVSMGVMRSLSKKGNVKVIERERDYDLLTSSKAKCGLRNQMLEKDNMAFGGAVRVS